MTYEIKHFGYNINTILIDNMFDDDRMLWLITGAS